MLLPYAQQYILQNPARCRDDRNRGIRLTKFIFSLEEQTSKKVQRQNSVKRRDDKIIDLERRRTK